jgi:hypothetical protein
MREQNNSILPVLKHNGRLNKSVVPRHRRKRPNAQKHGVFRRASQSFPVKIRANLKYYIPL